MRYYLTNMTVLDSWRRAHGLLGPDVAAAFGMRAEELRLVGQASPDKLHEWSSIDTPLVRPLRGLLAALHDDDMDPIYGFIVDTRTRFSRPELKSTLHAFNRQMLGHWHTALCRGEELSRYELDPADCGAIATAAEHGFHDWAEIPLAMAVPRDGLIRALAEASGSALYALIGPWRQAS